MFLHQSAQLLSTRRSYSALLGPSPPFRNLRLESAMAREEENKRVRESQVAPLASKEQMTTSAPRAPYVSPPPSASVCHSLLIDPL